jgi:hypothetical protein
LLDSNSKIDENSISAYSPTNQRLIRTELINRAKKEEFHLTTIKYIEYLPYRIELNELCYPKNYSSSVPFIGWTQAVLRRNSYYHFEVLHVLYLYIAKLYVDKLPDYLPSLSNFEVLRNSRNVTKINILMSRLAECINNYLEI